MLLTSSSIYSYLSLPIVTVVAEFGVLQCKFDIESSDFKDGPVTGLPESAKACYRLPVPDVKARIGKNDPRSNLDVNEAEKSVYESPEGIR